MSKNQDRADFVRLLASLLPVYNCGIEQAITHADEALSLVKARFPDEPPDLSSYSSGDDKPQRELALATARANRYREARQILGDIVHRADVDVEAMTYAIPSGAGDALVDLMIPTPAPELTVPAPVEAAVEDGVERVTISDATEVTDYAKTGNEWVGYVNGRKVYSGSRFSAALDEILAQRKKAEAAEKDALFQRRQVCVLADQVQHERREGEREKARADALEEQHLEDCRLIEAMTASARAALDKISALEAALPHWRAGMRMAEEFCERCDRGEVRSTHTYSKFRAILSAARAAGLTWEE